MKWIGKRISFEEDKLKTTIIIYPDNNGWINSIMGAWVAMWYAIGATMIWSYFKLELSEQENIIVIVFLVFWLYYAVKVSRRFFWLLWGKELIKIDETALYYKKSVRQFGKSVPYFLENISKIRLFHPKERSIQAVWEQSAWVSGGERIEFDHMGKIIKLGKKLTEKDTQLLFKLITKRIEERLRKKK